VRVQQTTMCIFSKPIKDVGQTRIFVSRACRPSADEAPAEASLAAPPSGAAGGAGWRESRTAYAAQTRQLTVYSNQVQLMASGEPTAMILPVPVSAATRLKAGGVDGMCGITVYDMPPCSDDFFVVLEKHTPNKDLFRMPFGANRPSRPLDVRRAGAYTFTVVPTVEDFPRLRTDVFHVPTASELLGMLAAHYSGDFAFLVCVIDASATYRPIAYEHDTLPTGDLFVPTRHYHPHEGPRSRTDTDKADWDHKIFSVGVDADDAGWYINAPLSGGATLRLDVAMEAAGVVGLPFHLPEVAGTELRMRPILGSRPNEDLIFHCWHGLD
jgi:hypothetical protein